MNRHDQSMENIDHILTLEVKREIAQRYFGFRKAIEEDSSAYMDKIRALSEGLEKKIGPDLIRIYTLLDQQPLIDRFLHLTGLPRELFTHHSIDSEPQKEELFSEQRIRGFTRKGCCKNIFFDSYTRLCRQVKDYRKTFHELAEDQETIKEQIRLFYRKNDINSILHFLRGLEADSPVGGTLHFDTASQKEFEDKMRIDPPPPVDELLPEIPELPENRAVKRQLKALVTQACRNQPDLDPRELK